MSNGTPAPGALLNMPVLFTPTGIITSVANWGEPGANGGSWGIDQVGQIWQGSREYKNTLIIQTSHAYVGPVAIMSYLQNIGIVIGASYVFPIPSAAAGVFATEGDTGSYIQRITLEQKPDDETCRTWLVRLEYGPFDIWHELGTSNVQYGSFTPLDFPPVIKWSTQKYHRWYATDVNGLPFVNTAGDPLENPPQREESTQVLRLILWSATPTAYDDSFAQQFRDTINADTFLGFPPKQVKCRDIDGERIYTTDYGYIWRLIYEFEMRQINIVNQQTRTTYTYGWQEKILNVGFRAFGGNTGVAVANQPAIPIKPPDGSLPQTPYILNPDGTCSVATGAAAVLALIGNPNYWLEFNNYPLQTFAQLNIDQDILTQNQ